MPNWIPRPDIAVAANLKKGFTVECLILGRLADGKARYRIISSEIDLNVSIGESMEDKFQAEVKAIVELAS